MKLSKRATAALAAVLMAAASATVPTAAFAATCYRCVDVIHCFTVLGIQICIPSRQCSEITCPPGEGQQD
jgi:hypothetical protein